MLRVLDGVTAPPFDATLNRKILEAAHQRMSESCDKVVMQDKGMARRSDNALLDPNALGPVYCKILKARRAKWQTNTKTQRKGN